MGRPAGRPGRSDDVRDDDIVSSVDPNSSVGPSDAAHQSDEDASERVDAERDTGDSKPAGPAADAAGGGPNTAADAVEPKRLTLHELATKHDQVAVVPRPGTELARDVKPYKWQHNVADFLHGWTKHEYHSGESLRLTEDDYLAALKAAENGIEPHAAAVAKGAQ